jgi:hypothetical protein
VYDIKQLRNLVQAVPPDQRSDAGDARIVEARLHARIRVGEAHVHGSKLQDLENTVVQSVTALTEENWTWRVQLDRKRDK